MEEAQKAALTIKQLDNVRSRMSDVVLGSKRISESAGASSVRLLMHARECNKLPLQLKNPLMQRVKPLLRLVSKAQVLRSWHPQLKILPPLPMNFNQSD